MDALLWLSELQHNVGLFGVFQGNKLYLLNIKIWAITSFDVMTSYCLPLFWQRDMFQKS